MNYNHNKNNIIITLAIIILIFFILFNFFTIPFYDDFVFYEKLKTTNLLSFLMYRYRTWSGTSLTIFALINYSFFLFNNLFLGVKLSTTFATILLIITSFILNKMYFVNNKFKQNFIYTIIITGILWINFRYTISKVLYWANGSYYIYIFFTSILFIYLIEQKKKNVSNLIVLGLLSFFLGSAGIRTLSLLTYLIFFFLKKENKYLLKKYIIAILPSFFIGEYYVLVAPGNNIRTAALGNLAVELFSILHNYLKGVDITLFHSLKFIIIASVLTAVLFLISEKKIEIKFWYTLRWLVISIISLSFFSLFKHGYFPLRATLLFSFSIMMFIAENLYLMFKKNEIKEKLILSFLVSIFILLFISYNFFQTFKYYNTYKKTFYTYLLTKKYHSVKMTFPNSDLSKVIPYYRKIRAKTYFVSFFKLKSLKVISGYKKVPIYYKKQPKYQPSFIRRYLDFQIERLKEKYGPIEIEYLKKKNEEIMQVKK